MINNDKKIIYTVSNLVKHLTEGNAEGKDLIIPEYQRDYVWDESKIPLLLDSMYKNYPIGAIVTWEDTKNNCIHLLDGLQRSFSIVKISNGFHKYVSIDLLEASLRKVLREIEPDLADEYQDKLVSYSSTIKNMLQEILVDIKKNGLDKELESLKLSISEKTNIKENYEIYIKIREFIALGLKSIIKFRDEDFGKYQIDRIEIDRNLSKFDVTEIFERLNTGAKELNNFEVYASNWSNYPLDTLEVPYVKKFIRERKQRYATIMGVDYENSRALKNRPITPSDFVYSTLITIFKDTQYFKDMFLKLNEQDIYSLKYIEELTYIFLNYFGLTNTNEDFKKLGKIIKTKLTDDEDVEEFRAKLKKAVKLVEENLTFFKFAKLNQKDYKNVKENLKISTHIFVSMINQTVNKLIEDENFTFNENQLNYWLLSESIDKVYGGNSGNKGIVATNQYRYVESMPKNLYKKIIQHIENEGEKQINLISNVTKMLLAFIQMNTQMNSGNLHIDHVIPQSLLKEGKIKTKVHTLYNLQLLDEKLNIAKNNTIKPTDYQFDVLKGTKYLSLNEDLEKYFQILSDCKTNLVLNYDSFYEFRKEKVQKLIKDVFDKK